MDCPICHRPVADLPVEGPRGDYPFCTPRCKLIDLGRWLAGAYQVPVQISPDEDADQRTPPPGGPQPPRR